MSFVLDFYSNLLLTNCGGPHNRLFELSFRCVCIQSSGSMCDDASEAVSSIWSANYWHSRSRLYEDSLYKAILEQILLLPFARY
jgi:hypothetical protein